MANEPQHAFARGLFTLGLRKIIENCFNIIVIRTITFASAWFRGWLWWAKHSILLHKHEKKIQYGNFEEIKNPDENIRPGVPSWCHHLRIFIELGYILKYV